MSNDAPGPVPPGSGPPLQPSPAGLGTPPPDAPAPDGWPAELVPPPATSEAETIIVPEPPAAAAEAAPTAPDPAATVPGPPVPVPTPPAAAPAATQWGAGTAPPPPGGGWGAQGQPPAQPGGEWGSPPQPPGGWGPPPGAQGAPPAGAWNPQPASSGNGCLKGCLIIGGILVVLVIIGVIGITALGMKLADDLGVNPDGTTKTCELITDGELEQVLGSGAQALPMGGIADATIGQVLDKRVIADAPDCWVFGASSGSTTGRVARQDGGDASGDFRSARQTAQGGVYFDGDVAGLGDEAFCTAISEFGAAGILVRSGGRLVYVSLIDTATLDGSEGPQHACAVSAEIASRMLR